MFVNSSSFQVCIPITRDNKSLLLRNYAALQQSRDSRESAHAFRSGETGWKVLDVIMATLASPHFMPPHKMGKYLHPSFSFLNNSVGNPPLPHQCAVSEWPEPAELIAQEARLRYSSLETVISIIGEVATPSTVISPELKAQMDKAGENLQIWLLPSGTKFFTLKFQLHLPDATLRELNDSDTAVVLAASESMIKTLDWRQLLPLIQRQSNPTLPTEAAAYFFKCIANPSERPNEPVANQAGNSPVDTVLDKLTLKEKILGNSDLSFEQLRTLAATYPQKNIFVQNLLFECVRYSSVDGIVALLKEGLDPDPKATTTLKFILSMLTPLK